MTAAHVPRHDLDAEAAVLSACLLDTTGAALDQARALVSAESWYRPAHRLVWEAACWLADRSEPVDVVTVAGRLKTLDRAAEVGGVSWLSALCDAAPHVANVEAYARTVRDTWTQRAVVATLQRAIAEGYGDVGDVRAWASSVEESLAKLSADSRTRRTSDFVGDVVRDVFERVRDGKAGLRVRTGLRSLDEKLTSQVGDLVIIAARPGMGKTALVGGIAVTVGLSESDAEHAAALMLSAEMDRPQIAQRLLSAEAKVPLSALRHANVGEYAWASLTQSAQRLDACALVLDDKPAPTLAHVRSTIRETKRNLTKWETTTGKPRALRLVIVDYLQIMGVDREKGKNREQETSELSRGLKQIAREEEVVVFALSQLNRGVEARANKRPLLSDLRESGAIEQDADAIVFVYRDEYYNPKGAKGVAECLVAKNRNDATGRAFVKFEGAYTMFSDLSVSEEEQLRREAKEDLAMTMMVMMTIDQANELAHLRKRATELQADNTRLHLKAEAALSRENNLMKEVDCLRDVLGQGDESKVALAQRDEAKLAARLADQCCESVRAVLVDVTKERNDAAAALVAANAAIAECRQALLDAQREMASVTESRDVLASWRAIPPELARLYAAAQRMLTKMGDDTQRLKLAEECAEYIAEAMREDERFCAERLYAELHDVLTVALSLCEPALMAASAERLEGRLST